MLKELSSVLRLGKLWSYDFWGMEYVDLHVAHFSRRDKCS